MYVDTVIENTEVELRGLEKTRDKLRIQVSKMEGGAK